ncbi:hypothetical protein K1719_018923 [Acacia pycnantha]|nr:hypothetical protein K1719_018923 [Acacia pycnantha]
MLLVCLEFLQQLQWLHIDFHDHWMCTLRIKVAREHFESARRDNVSVWNAMISGLATHGLALDAFEVFSRMKMENIFPDSITYIGFLTACSHCGLPEEGGTGMNLFLHRSEQRFDCSIIE